MVHFAPLCYFRRSAVEPDTQLYAKFLILKLDAYVHVSHVGGEVQKIFY